ncbi:cytochrome c biogenesis protein ResB [Thalassorhabdus alkalitolerans]|uniref:Cytochrome c biogenesis protein ResB n=1 Tax=Thalassorhabdus alkalitolerans TaxID=2282697 RepID=A0ABW0YIE9_9BACI
MSKITCSCGQVNPEGTDICQACGKPLTENVKNKQSILDMRYEGVARRSQTYNKSLIDKIWNFFSSVKVGVGIIVILLVSSSLGTLFPQELYIPRTGDPGQYYYEEYGVAGKVFYDLGFHNLYSSWWYMLLVAALGVSLLIASIDRVVPLYRSLKNQKVTRHSSFLKRQRFFSRTYANTAEIDNILTNSMSALQRKKYKVRQENGNLFAEKGRFSRWGPYVNHVGLIIFLIGVMLRFFPGMYVDEVLWLREGDKAVIPGTNGEYYLENEEFKVELYDQEDELFGEAIARAGGRVVENYQTNATLYQSMAGEVVGQNTLEEKFSGEIRVNEPMKFSNFGLYQVDYKLNEFSTITFALEDSETEEVLGEFTVDLFDPKNMYEVGDGNRVELREYYPNYFLDDDGLPSTESSIPDNPAFIFDFFTPDTPEGESSFLGIGRNVEPMGEEDNQYQIRFADIDTHNVTGLTVRKDQTLGLISVGGVIFMIGLVQGSYWNHRRIWIQNVNGEVWMSAHTNKNIYGIKKDLESISTTTGLIPPIDQKEKEGKER